LPIKTGTRVLPPRPNHRYGPNTILISSYFGTISSGVKRSECIADQMKLLRNQNNEYMEFNLPSTFTPKRRGAEEIIFGLSWFSFVIHHKHRKQEFEILNYI
jgi:hypothetical protein